MFGRKKNRCIIDCTWPVENADFTSKYSITSDLIQTRFHIKEDLIGYMLRNFLLMTTNNTHDAIGLLFHSILITFFNNINHSTGLYVSSNGGTNGRR